MSNLDGIEEKIEKADGIATKLTAFLKSHWKLLVLLLFLYGGYKFCVLVGEEMDKDDTEYYEEGADYSDTNLFNE